jgi:hypothetical protein
VQPRWLYGCSYTYRGCCHSGSHFIGWLSGGGKAAAKLIVGGPIPALYRLHSPPAVLSSITPGAEDSPLSCFEIVVALTNLGRRSAGQSLHYHRRIASSDTLYHRRNHADSLSITETRERRCLVLSISCCRLATATARRKRGMSTALAVQATIVAHWPSRAAQSANFALCSIALVVNGAIIGARYASHRPWLI